MDTTNDWERLGEMVRAERANLGITQAELGADAGISEQTVSNIERARVDRYRPRTLDSVERALGWMPGSIDAILNGREPDRAIDVLDQVEADLDGLGHELRDTDEDDENQRAGLLMAINHAEQLRTLASEIVAGANPREPISIADSIEAHPDRPVRPRTDTDATLLDHEHRIRDLEESVAALNQLVVRMSAGTPSRISTDHALAADTGERPPARPKGRSTPRPGAAPAEQEDF